MPWAQRARTLTVSTTVLALRAGIRRACRPLGREDRVLPRGVNASAPPPVAFRVSGQVTVALPVAPGLSVSWVSRTRTCVMPACAGADVISVATTVIAD